MDPITYRARLLRLALESVEAAEEPQRAFAFAQEVFEWAAKAEDAVALDQAIGLMDRFHGKRLAWSHLRETLRSVYDFLRMIDAPSEGEATPAEPESPAPEVEAEIEEEATPAAPESPDPAKERRRARASSS